MNKRYRGVHISTRLYTFTIKHLTDKQNENKKISTFSRSKVCNQRRFFMNFCFITFDTLYERLWNFDFHVSYRRVYAK